MTLLATLQVDEGRRRENIPGGISNETVYSVLSDKRRRYAVHYLKQRDGPVSVRDLSEQIAAWENDKEPEDLTSKERKRVYIALYQSHLSTLANQGIVDYDKDRGMVSLSPTMADFDLYLEAVPKGTVPWSLYYLGLSGVNAVLLLLAWWKIAPFSTVPDLAWGAVVLVTFGVSALVQSLQTRRMRFGDPGPPPEYADGQSE